MRMKTIYLSASLVAITALSACGKNLQEDLGLVKKAPDEFAVVTRAPLSVPPDYTLRPPTPGSQRPMEISTKDAARQSVFGKSDMTSGGVANTSTPSGSFLDKVGATNSDPAIRQVIDSEMQAGAEDNRSTGDKLMFWRSQNAKAEGTPIDPIAEKKRLDEEGVTTIKKRNEGIEAP
jgi:hypothetical protein